jgi:hypothetical protein
VRTRAGRAPSRCRRSSHSPSTQIASLKKRREQPQVRTRTTGGCITIRLSARALEHRRAEFERKQILDVICTLRERETPITTTPHAITQPCKRAHRTPSHSTRTRKRQVAQHLRHASARVLAFVARVHEQTHALQLRHDLETVVAVGYASNVIVQRTHVSCAYIFDRQSS